MNMYTFNPQYANRGGMHQKFFFLKLNQVFEHLRFFKINLNLLKFVLLLNALLLASIIVRAQDCNTITNTNEDNYEVSVSNSNSSLGSPLLSGLNNVISSSPTDFATISGGILDGWRSITVKYGTSGSPLSYPANTFAGFEIREGSGLLGLDLLSSLKIQTLDSNGNVLETKTGSSALVGLSLLNSASGTQYFGFTTSQSFSQVRITYSSGLVSLGTLRVYGAVVKKMCENSTGWVCNTIDALVNPAYPVNIDMQNTGIDGAANALGGVNNVEHLIDNNSTNYATISGVNVLNTKSITIKKELSKLAADSNFVGFDIQSSSTLLEIGALSGLTVSVMNNGVVVQFATNTQLLTLNLFSSAGNRAIIGFVPSVEFDAIKLSIGGGLVSTNLLGDIKVYAAVVKRMCEKSDWACNEVEGLVNPTYPVNIDMANTGITGVGTLLGSVDDAGYIIDDNNANYATISGLNLVSTASITVKKELSKFAADSNFVGFDIEGSGSLLDLGLLNGLSISVLKDGVVAQSKSNTQFLRLALFSAGGNRVTVGFTPTVEFDAVQLSVNGGLISTSLLGQLKVYGAVIKHFCPFTTNPDIAVTSINVPVTGSVGTNDDVPDNTVYSIDGSPSIPPGSTPIFTMNADGTYDFITDVPGIYTYVISVCAEAMPACPNEELTISVMDEDAINGPVVNVDIANVKEGSSVVIPGLENDHAGINGAALDPASVTLVTSPTNGIASVDPLTGDVTYTPTIGFTGTDILVYQVCDLNSNCATAEQKIHVTPNGSNTTSASPDFYTAVQGSVITGNVSLNDIDPEGDNTTVTFLDTPTPAQGSLTFNPDGSFVFTPNLMFTGPLQLTYQTCDAGTPSACATETLNLLYEKGDPELSTTITYDPAIIGGASVVNVFASIYNSSIISSNGLITIFIDKDPKLILNFNQLATTVGGETVNNPNWTFDDTSNSFYYILTSNVIISGSFDFQTIGLSSTFNPSGTQGSRNISISLQSGSGGDKTADNNSNDATLVYFP